MNGLRLVALISLLAASTLAAQAPTQKSGDNPKKDDQCSIAGTVVKLAGGEPLRKARITLRSQNDRTRSISTTTDSGGRFELKSIDPGGYKLTVSRVGFVTFEYGQRKPGDPGATLTLRPKQQINDLVFRLIPSAVISGRILDEDGEPLPSVTISAWREAYQEGKRTLSMSANAETNDLGEYRLYGLPPGRYIVSAVHRDWESIGQETVDSGDPASSTQGYAKMYYPGTPDSAKASPVVVKSGEEIPSVEMLMRQVLVYRIRGHVYNQITHKPGEGANIMLIPRTTNPERDIEQYAFVQKPDGSFEIPEVLPGSYVLTAFWVDEGKIYSSRMPVDVGNANVEGLAVIISAGTNINGRVVWDGRPSLEKDELTISPEPKETRHMFRNSSRVNADNSFTLKDVGDGAYTADVGGESRDCYIKDITYAGNSVLDDGFTVVRGSPGFLEIILSSRGARVQGAVTDEDGLPAAGVWAVLVPDAAHASQYRLYKQQTTDQYGHFDLRGIAPGDYKLFSWDDVEEGAWGDPDFLKPFEEKGLGEKITVQAGDAKSISIVTIKTAAVQARQP
jgi:protocatechuate 3,4-dioxygenase beta subunit